MSERVDGINYIRICCMLIILLFHAKIHYGIDTPLLILDEIISIGAVAIVGFYMMSGFCLRKRYQHTNIIKNQGFGSYIKKRLTGIYPGFLFLLLCTFIFDYRLGTNWADTLKILPMEMSLLHITLNPLLNGYFFNDNFWYISTLFILYLLFPYLNELADGIDKKKRWILCAIFPIISWYIYYLNIYIVPGNTFLFYYTNPFFRIPEFFVGILAADIVNEETIKIKWWQIIGCTLFAGVVISLLYPFWNVSYNLYNIILIPYFLVLLLAAGTMKDNGLLAVIAKSKPVKYITSLGLSVYLCQSISIMVLEKEWLSIPSNRDGIAFIIMTIIFSILLHEIVEKPGKYFLCAMERRKKSNEE